MAEDERGTNSLAHRTTEIASGDGSGDRARSGTLPFDWRPALDPDAVLAGRYRIVRFLARGGMGEVYEAEDLVLRMRVALKAIAPELVVHEEMIERLKQEVLLARKVTHANVCRLHDLGFDAGLGGTSAFLTMDLLSGDTLAAHIAHKGRLSTREALPIVRQFGEALEAAHEAGVIHRDFKTRNVMLVPGTGGAKTRAVVMDFGIAVAVEKDEQRALDAGRFVGTPAYMAPEQMKGGEITRATDVYALGVVLFEMVTGALPFEGALTDLISSRLTKPPPSPRARVRSIDRGWDAVIMKCLAPEPAKRFASVRQVLDALDTRRATMMRVRIGVGAGMAIAGVVAAAAWSHARASSDAAIVDARRRPTLAITMSDRSATDDTRWLATALSGMLTAELDADEALRVVPANRVAEAKRDLGIGDDAIATPASLTRLRDNLAVDYVVVGSYVAGADGSARVELALDDARTGKTAARAASRGTTGKLFDLATPLASAVRKRLGVRDPTDAEIVAARATATDNAGAMRGYAEGSEKLATSDYAAAMNRFEQAVQLDPSFALAHDGLGVAALRLGDDARALEEARKAFELSRSLSREQQLGIEQRYRENARDWDRATAIARALVEFYPDNVDYGLRYVRALFKAGKSKDALVEVDHLHALPPPDGDDARIDINEALAAGKISDPTRKLAAARRAIAKAERTGQLSVLADGHHYAGGALQALHRPDEARVETEKALDLYVKLHDRKFEASCLRTLMWLRVEAGDPASAKPIGEQTLAIFRELGVRYDTASLVLDLTGIHWLLGDDVKARALGDEARGLWEAIHDREGIGWALEWQGYLFEDEGDLAHAKESFTQARETLREVDQANGVTETTINLAALAVMTDDVKSATSELADGEEGAKKLGDEELIARAALVRAQMAMG